MDKNTFASIDEYPMLEYVMRYLGVKVDGLPEVPGPSKFSERKLRNFLNKFNKQASQLRDMIDLNSVLSKRMLCAVSATAGTKFVTSKFDVPLFASLLRDKYDAKIERELMGNYPDRVICSVKGYVRQHISDVAGLSK